MSTPQNNPARGAALAILGTGLITVNDAAMKWVVADVPVGEAIFVRGLFALGPIALLVRRQGGRRTLRFQSLWRQLLCGALLVAALFLFVHSLTLLSLAVTTIVLYVSPLLSTALAPLLLREHVGWRRWSAVVVGFAGVALVVGPGLGAGSPVLLLPLLVALLSGLRDILIRTMVARETSLSIMFFTTVMVIVTALPTALGGWVPLDWRDLGLLAIAGLGFGFGLYCLTDALRWAEVSLVAPLKYTGVVWALILGVLVWGDLPDTRTLLGAALVVGAGVFVLRRGARRPSSEDE